MNPGILVFSTQISFLAGGNSLKAGGRGEQL
jgi:hypothetical protein